MMTTFRIHFATAPGESLHIVSGDSRTPLRWRGDGWWGAAIEMPPETAYHYEVVSDGPLARTELPPRRTTPLSLEAGTVLVDRWRDHDSTRASRSSALFSKAVAARHHRPSDTGATPTAAPGGRHVTFRLLEPSIPPGSQPVVVGSSVNIGEWDPAQAAPMSPNDFPWWEASVDVEDGSMAYKYAIVDEAGDVVTWEGGANRTLPPDDAPLIVMDDEVRGLEGWRGAGIAIPLFALRSPSDVGVGQFTDLTALADWAASVDLSVIQLLPVNDTVLYHEWQDSYPYNPVSVQALHPLYVDLAAIPGAGIADRIQAARTLVNELPEVDYVKVMQLKWELLAAAYKKLAPGLDADDAFAEFVGGEWGWLGPYSAWCVLRERNGTPDFERWGNDARFDPDRLSAMASPASPDYSDLRFHWFVQYHLHRQLTGAADYARMRGVALKGDLPIGVAPESVEVWTRPARFHVGAQTGAPPDAFSVRGQNWQFPTYDWDHMAADGYEWWRARFQALARYVDVFRIDHVLGFFRIWEIPPTADDGRLGYFRPCLPLSADEVRAAIGPVDVDALTQSLVDPEAAAERFGPHAETVVRSFFTSSAEGLRLLPPVATQRQIIEAFERGALRELPADERGAIRRALLDAAADVLLVNVGDEYQPRISWQDTENYRLLSVEQRAGFDELAIDYFHHRHSQQWALQGRTTLPAVVEATDLLTCGEDLGMVPDLVPQLMNEMGLLSLEIERMPKRLGEWIADPADAPYLSVVSPSTHDTTTLRMWWEEDRQLIDRYWREALGQAGPPPATATPEVSELIVRRQLASPAMLCIIPMSDLLAIDGSLRRDEIDTERINDPANRHNRWRYRLQLTLDELMAATTFNDRVRSLITESGR